MSARISSSGTKSRQRRTSLDIAFHSKSHLASSLIQELLTVADLEHSGTEERWFSIGTANDGKILAAYLWSESEPRTTKIRLISARQATSAEVRQYEENL